MPRVHVPLGADVELQEYISDNAGGFTPVACVLAPAGSIDVAAVNPAYFVWDTIYDDVAVGNELTDFPAGMGLAALGGGTDTLTTTEPGVWAFTIDGLQIPADATWFGQVIFGNNTYTPSIDVGVVTSGTRAMAPSGVFNLPVGAQFSVGIATGNAPTANPFNCSLASMCVVRLA